jgi:formamidopyrimidine-DNA glycosylase
MPEVIEVRKYADFIRSRVLGKSLQDIIIQGGRYKKHGSDDLRDVDLPSKVTSVENKGKFMYIGFQSGQFIGVTLGLSGGWMFQSKKPKRLEWGLDPGYDLTEQDIQDDPYLQKTIRHINVVFVFPNGELYFYDTLSFGTLKLFSSQEELDLKLKTLGPDIMDPDFEVSVFEDQLNKYPSKPIGNVLMNQKVVSDSLQSKECVLIEISRNIHLEYSPSWLEEPYSLCCLENVAEAHRLWSRDQ